MKLYVTPTSPYARLAMIVRLSLELEDRVELVWTKTRVPDDPLLAVNPSGRIPFLQLDAGSGFEDTDVIVEYLDSLAAPRRFARPDIDGTGAAEYWRFRRLEASARGMLDGVSVWAREIIRPEAERSPGIIAQERRRAGRLAHMFDGEIGLAPLALTGQGLNISQLLLFCALDVHRRLPDMDWRDGCPGLSDWYDRMLEIPAVRGSLPPTT
jgi:glutathione S-transferase